MPMQSTEKVNKKKIVNYERAPGICDSYNWSRDNVGLSEPCISMGLSEEVPCSTANCTQGKGWNNSKLGRKLH